ncbi:uncharacterized protein LOC129216508 [Uloborus diversus]|uniref:uncharacterized protein LOC129216508 n=1 Tax=Uloborus diversus TaxID=327109 RepID=UPI0024098429|nr:uncharacterized protein LOC129216508 [Uloborus diversus]
MGYFQVLLISFFVTKISAVSSNINEENGHKSHNSMTQMEEIRLNRHLFPHLTDFQASASELISIPEEVFKIKNYSETSSKLMALEDRNHPVVGFRENSRPRLMGIWKMWPDPQQQGENGKDNLKKLASIVETRSFITNPELSFHINNSPESRNNFKTSKQSERKSFSKEYSSLEGRDKNSEAISNSNGNSAETVSDYGQMLPKDYRSNIEKLAEEFIEKQKEKNNTEMEGKKTQVEVKNVDKNKSHSSKAFFQSKGKDRTKSYDDSEEKFANYNAKNANKHIWDDFNKNPVHTKLLSDTDGLHSSEKRPPLSEEHYNLQNPNFENNPLYSGEKLASIEEHYSKSPSFPPDQNPYKKFNNEKYRAQKPSNSKDLETVNFDSELKGGFIKVTSSHLKNRKNQRLTSATVPILSSVEYNAKVSEPHRNSKEGSQHESRERTQNFAPSVSENARYLEKNHGSERHHLYKKVRRETNRTSNPKQSKGRKLNRRDDDNNGQKATYHWGLEKHKNMDGFFQYANVPHAQEFEYGYRVGGPEHTQERHHKTEGKHSTIKLNWKDKNGDFGDQYWEFNHDSAESDSKDATNGKKEKVN